MWASCFHIRRPRALEPRQSQQWGGHAWPAHTPPTGFTQLWPLPGAAPAHPSRALTLAMRSLSPRPQPSCGLLWEASSKPPIRVPPSWDLLEAGTLPWPVTGGFQAGLSPAPRAQSSPVLTPMAPGRGEVGTGKDFKPWGRGVGLFSILQDCPPWARRPQLSAHLYPQPCLVQPPGSSPGQLVHLPPFPAPVPLTCPAALLHPTADDTPPLQKASLGRVQLLPATLSVGWASLFGPSPQQGFCLRVSLVSSLPPWATTHLLPFAPLARPHTQWGLYGHHPRLPRGLSWARPVLPDQPLRSCTARLWVPLAPVSHFQAQRHLGPRMQPEEVSCRTHLWP